MAYREVWGKSFFYFLWRWAVMFDVAQMLRIKDQELRGSKKITDWKILASEGKVEGIKEWYFHKKGQMLLNGSLTNKDAPPTKISLKVIQEGVRIGING